MTDRDESIAPSAEEESAESSPPNQGKERVISLPELCLVALVGASGCGKSTFAARHFKPTEVLSSDAFRAWVSDDELDQSATDDAFDMLYALANKRLERGKLVVVDATNVQLEARKALVQLARAQNVLAAAIVFNVPERVCLERNANRADRKVPPHAIGRQSQQLRRSLRDIGREGFRYTYTLGIDEAESVRVERKRLWTDKRDDPGPFDIIGDVHGCADELIELLGALGYSRSSDDEAFRHPLGRRALFVGDFVDRGPSVVETLDIVRAMVESGNALAVPGNHDDKLLRWLRGRKVTVSHGLAESIAQIEQIPAHRQRDWRESTSTFLDGLISHFVLDGGSLVVAHAGLIEKMQGRASGAVREFCLYGDATGEIDEAGLPVRRDWAAMYRGRAAVVYGHTPTGEARWINNTINIDTGCVFGGSLTALRWPERALVQVPSRRAYAEPGRSFLTAPRENAPAVAESRYDLLLTDVFGAEGYAEASVAGQSGAAFQTLARNRRVATDLMGSVTIAPENSAAALELMSRFGVDPRWMVYLPPTMSPCETERDGEYLEHPRGAFAFYQRAGVTNVICEEKHMGSRAVIVICRDESAARRRFGVRGGIGECYTRTGRRFFEEPVRSEFLKRVRSAADTAGLWDARQTDWIVIDAEILPWNAKAQGLLREQYAPVGAAATASLRAATRLAGQAAANGVAIDPAGFAARSDAVARYIDAYRAYCWPMEGLAGVQVAPFHLLATEGAVHADKEHSWHLGELRRLCAADDRLFRATDSVAVDLSDPKSVQAGIDWWLAKTGAAAEGMVVKPSAFVSRQEGRGSLLQPAVKCRGREYLRIIYGPEYTLPENLESLRERGLNRKRQLALREFALGIEGLSRFVNAEPLHRVHECAFAVLALESEPVDPRL